MNKNKIIKFFIEEGYAEIDAEEFYNFNQSREWKNISDWKPLALNWFINIKKNKENDNKKSNSENKNKYKLEEQNYDTRF